MKQIFLLPALLFSMACFGQETKPVWKRDTIIGTNKFLLYNNWLSVGGGIASNSRVSKQQVIGTFDYNFHIQKEYFQLGIMLSGPAVGSYTTKQAHVGYGRRKENTKRNLSAFAGFSFSEVYNDTSFGYNGAAGVYLQAAYIFKVAYDVGIGPSVYAEINARQSIVGIKLDVYFSGAYKGSTKKKKRTQY